MNLIAEIVNDIFTDGQGRKAKRLVMEFEDQHFNETGRNELSVHSIIKKHLEAQTDKGGQAEVRVIASEQRSDLANGAVAKTINDYYMILWDDGYHNHKNEFTNIEDVKDFINKKKQSAYFNNCRVYKQIATATL